MYIKVAGNGEEALKAFPNSKVMTEDNKTVLITKEYRFGEIEEKLNSLQVLSAIRIGNL